MHEDYKKFIDRVVWGILSASAIVSIKFLTALNDNINELSLQLSKNTIQLQYHEQELKTLNSNNSAMFRIEGQLGYHERRISKLENRRG